MLTRLRLRNFMSFRDSSVSFGKLNVVVGANASGKTNLLRALELLGNLAKLGYPYVEGFAGNSPAGGWYLDLGSLVYNFDVGGGATVSVDASIGSIMVSYTVKMGIEGFEEEVVRGREILLRGSSREQSCTYVARDGSPRTISRPATVNLDIIYYDSYGGKRSQRISAYPSVLTHVPADAHPTLRGLAALLREVKVLHPDQSPLRAKVAVRGSPDVSYRGEGLARQLLQLCLEKRREYEEVEKAVRGLLPDLEAIVPRLEGDEVEIQIRMSGNSRPIPASCISDGALRLTCLVAALHSGSTLVAFEAPESFLHPKQLELLVALARLAEPQIVFTTYSPQLLDYAQPEEVIVVTRTGTESKAERLVESPSYKLVRELLETGGSLSEAWLSGLF